VSFLGRRNPVGINGNFRFAAIKIAPGYFRSLVEKIDFLLKHNPIDTPPSKHYFFLFKKDASNACRAFSEISSFNPPRHRLIHHDIPETHHSPLLHRRRRSLFISM
jgi:hypothetical protein